MRVLEQYCMQPQKMKVLQCALISIMRAIIPSKVCFIIPLHNTCKNQHLCLCITGSIARGHSLDADMVLDFFFYYVTARWEFLSVHLRGITWDNQLLSLNTLSIPLNRWSIALITVSIPSWILWDYEHSSQCSEHTSGYLEHTYE